MTGVSAQRLHSRLSAGGIRSGTIAAIAVALLSVVLAYGRNGTAHAATAPVHSVVVIPLDDGLETGSPVIGANCAGCDDLFQRVTVDAHTGRYSLFGSDAPRVSDLSAYSFGILIPQNATAAGLRFWQRFDFEHNVEFNYDGAVLEISTDDAMTWSDLGPHITAGGYNGTVLQNERGNPLGGRPAWVGTSSDWQQVTVDLMSYRGQRINFRLRIGTDDSNFATFGGWFVDDFQITYQAPLTCARAWDTLTAPPTTVTFAAVASVGADLYAFGGAVDSQPTADAFRYSTKSNSWDPIASLPEARVGASAVSDGRYIYIVGGIASYNGPPTASLWRYDPVANSYLTLASFATATAYQAAAYLDGTLYKIAGQTDVDGERHTDAVEAYSIANNGWSSVAAYPTALRLLAAVAIDGYIYTAVGEFYQGDHNGTYRYDPASDTWDTGPIADIPPPGGIGSGAFNNDTLIVFAGGLPFGWDPRVNIWRSLDQLPTSLVVPTVSVSGNAAYVFGKVQDAEEGALLRYVETNCGCLGDCGGDSAVSVSELVRGVGIALHTQPLSGCMAFDGDGDGNVAVNELVKAVGNALNGCSDS